MPIKAKYNSSYKDITDLMNVDESIDYVLAKTSSSYKRVYTATRSIEDTPPTTFKSIKPGANLTDYRIYGNTSKNILPLSKTPKTETIGDILCEYDGKGTFTFTSNVDNPTYTQDQWFWVPFEKDFDFPVGISDGGHGCIQLNNDFATEYGVTPYLVGFANRDNGEFVSGFNVAGTALNIIDTNYEVEDLEGLPANCIAFLYLHQIGKRTVTIKPALYLDIRTRHPFEPYGESVGDRTENLFDETLYNKNVGDDMIIYVPIYVGNIDYVTCSTTCPKTIFGNNNGLNSRYIFILSGNVNTGALNSENGVSNGAPRTMQPSDGYVTIAYRKIEKQSIRPWEYQTMLNVGSTALPYEPYGYKVPVTVEGNNLFDYDTITHGYRIQWKTGGNYADETAIMSDFISVSENSTYATDTKLYWLCYDANKQYIGAWDGSDIVKSGVDAINSMTAISPCKFIRILSFSSKTTPISSTTMLNCGSTALPYEPYHAPITTPIYLPEQIRKVAYVAEYIDYGEQKFVKKFYKITLNFDDMNNAENFPGWVGDTAVVEYCNKLRSLPIDTPEGYTPFQRTSISNFKAMFNVRGNILFLGVSSVIGHKQSELKKIYAGQSITFILKIPDTDLDVTLPALPTLPGANVLSVGTEVQPSKIDITGHIKTISGGS